MHETTEREHDEFRGALDAGLEAMGLSISPGERQLLFSHYQLLIEANRQFNLTRITSPADAAVKHYADSLSLLSTPWCRAGDRLRILDVGTGAGFPAVPLAIMCHTWSVMAIDGTGKKVRFVEKSAEALGLANLDAMHARAGELAREGDWSFDLLVVRAVGQMDKVLIELAPLLSPIGAVVFYKTAHLEQAEHKAAADAARQLHLRMDTHRVNLPLADQLLERQLIRYSRQA